MKGDRTLQRKLKPVIKTPYAWLKKVSSLEAKIQEELLKETSGCTQESVSKQGRKFLKCTLGSLMVMFNSDDENEFWNAQQDWNIEVTDAMLEFQVFESEEDSNYALELISWIVAEKMLPVLPEKDMLLSEEG
ncbi:hypothetical protein Tco_1107109 [Tanacetum coccineum]